jgi:hypothetical protein
MQYRQLQSQQQSARALHGMAWHGTGEEPYVVPWFSLKKNQKFIVKFGVIRDGNKSSRLAFF